MKLTAPSLRLAAVTAALALSPVAARAAFTEVALPTLNSDVRTYSDGAAYNPFFPSTPTFNGVPFDLTVDSNSNTVWQINGRGDTLTIPVNVFGVTSAYSLINSAFGALGSNNGTVTFNGSGGLTYSVDLIQGLNIRDHYYGGFNNVIDGVTAVPILAFSQAPGNAHLDEQLYFLPAAFATATLTDIVLTGTGDGGLPFIAALTVADGTASIPEPASLALLGLGLAGLGAARTRRLSR